MADSVTRSAEEAATDLRRLHDIVVPDPPSWWPMAPGWQVIAAAAAVALAVVGFHLWKRHRANRYRREALRELESITAPDDVAVILRRTALAIIPRAEVAALTGARWVDWLATTGPAPPAPSVRPQLIEGPYASAPRGDAAALRAWAADWIRHHRVPPRSSG